MRIIARIVCLVILEGCAGDLSSVPAQPLVTSDRQASGVRVNASSQRIYAVNNSGNSLTAYHANANGNVAPDVTIAGSNTQLSTPINIATGFQHRLLVTNLGTNAVTEYAGGANGNAAPLAVITCGGLNFPDGIAVGSSAPLGPVHIYVANLKGNSISIFPRGAHGCMRGREINGSNTQLSRPAALLISSGVLYVGNLNSHSITEYPASASGNVAPTTVISGGNTMLVNPVGLALDSSQNLYVADDSAQAILVFAAGASGNASPIRVIAGSNTGLSSPSGIVVASGGPIMVTNPAANSITSYPETANGNVAPKTTLQGSATCLNFPIGLTLH
jgi:6-phosphogluconolactonase (cycloisomerase 2 family)